jgi:hypothetical protein
MDLEEFPFWFPDGDIYAFEEHDSVYLAGASFEELREASQVHEAALQVVDEFSAVISLLWSNHRRPTVSNVIREMDDGKRNQFSLSYAIGMSRSKGRATITVQGQAPDDPLPKQGQQLLAGSRSNDHLRAALSLWGDPLRTWPRLYRILEEVERYLGQPVHKALLCTKQERERFKRSANTAEIAGKDARHTMGNGAPPNNPMDLGEAVTLIGRVLREALERATGAPGSAA